VAGRGEPTLGDGERSRLDTRLVWLRRDLRLHDHPALAAALRPCDDAEVRVVPLFVLDPRLLGSRRVAPARLRYLAEALADLDAGLRQRGGRLVVRRGDPRRVVPAVAREVRASAVHVTGDVTPYAADRDAAVAARLGDVPLRVHPGLLVHEPGTVLTGGGRPFRVFTPFHRAWLALPADLPLPAPARIPAHGGVASDGLPTAADLLEGATPPAEARHDGGETAALRRLDRFLTTRAADYHQARDLLGVDGTSRLSADLHHGCLSPRQAMADLDPRRPGHRTFAAELAWREFYAHVLAAWPEVLRREFNPAMRRLPWRGRSRAFTAWCDGRTGYPVVDAAMRQLRAEGWMHNRGRMIVASFLCKDLLVDWRLGEAHFLRHLVDGDLASNNGGWQWAAGTGTDAQPYFRIFNPVTQGQRFDPDGAYVRRYVPELAGVPTRWIHRPWELPASEAEACGLRVGVDYPHPIVDHGHARREALAWFARHRTG
jgi:deoxyribodipyrimidine photo-lyase